MPKPTKRPTAKEESILTAAMAWAKAERRLRDRVNYSVWPLTGERRHQISLEADYTEEQLLKACEAP